MATATSEELISVLDVNFEYNHDKILPCPDLKSELNSGNFDSLVQHVSNLVTIYSVPGNQIDRARTYMCLEALELDLSILSQVPLTGYSDNSLRDINKLDFSALPRSCDKTPTDIDPGTMRDRINHSLVGHFLPRSGGRLGQLTYLVTPAQAAVSRRSTRISQVGAGSTDGILGGYMARVGLRPRATNVPGSVQLQQLAFMPLVTLHEDTCGNRIPDFAQLDEIKCLSVEAELVLYLDPPVPLTTEGVKQLEDITGLANSALDPDGDDDLVRLILRRHNEDHLFGINTHLQMPNNTQHAYEVRSKCRGYLVREIPFTCSSQLGPIIALLRQHASAAAFFETFVVHPHKPVEKDISLTFQFSVSIHSISHMNVRFTHPCDPSRCVHVELEIGLFEVERAVVNDLDLKPDKDSPSVMSTNLTKLLAHVHALPIGLVQVLSELGCPLNRKLPIRTVSDAPAKQTGVSDQINTVANPRLLNHLRGMLSRARSHVVIQGATGTGGVLSGADCFAAAELDLAALPSIPMSTTASTMKMPPLPPGVLATPPPAVPAAHGAPGAHSRSLRLDDLLVDSMLQQCLATAPSLPSSNSEGSLAGKSVFTPTVANSAHWQSKSASHRDLIAESLAAAPVVPTVRSAAASVVPAGPLPPGTYNNRSASAQSTSVMPVSVPGTFAPNSLLINPSNSNQKGSAPPTSSSSKTSTNTSGSMLVNLLNEDPPPPSGALSQLQQPILNRFHPTASQTYSLPPVLHDGSRDACNRPPPVMAPVNTSPLVCSRILTSNTSTNPAGPSPNTTVVGTKLPTVSPAVPMPCSPGLNKPKPTVPPSTVTLPANAPVMKKQRKKHRTNVDGPEMLNQQRANPLVSSTPRQFGHVSKPQRTDLSNVSYHRSSSASTMPYVPGLNSMASNPTGSVHSLSSASLMSTGKSVYDFDDTPSSLFELSGSSLSSYACPTGTPTSKLSSSAASSYSASNSSLLSSSGPGSSSYPSGVGSSSAIPTPERAVERKSSLKVTIKALPAATSSSSQLPTKTDSFKFSASMPLGAETTSGTESISSPPVKRRKKRSVDGKPTSYMLQMLQQPSVATNTSVSPGKGAKAPIALMNHVSQLVKKERKRRVYGLTDKSKPVSVELTSMAAVTSEEALPNAESQRFLGKTERDPATALKLPVSASGISSTASVKNRDLAFPKKKHHILPGAGLTSESGKRFYPGSGHSAVHAVDQKRKKHANLAKISLPVAQPSQMGTTQYELEKCGSANHEYAESAQLHSMSESNLRGSHVPPQIGTGGLKKLRSVPPFSSSIHPVSHSASHSASGMIKGYKIPKKKTISGLPSGELPPSNYSITGSGRTSSDSCADSSDSTRTTQSNVVPTSSTVSSDQGWSVAVTTPQVGAESADLAEARQAALVDTTQPLQCSSLTPTPAQQLFKKQSIKSISDIVDKLRAKSSSTTVQSSSGQLASGDSQGSEGDIGRVDQLSFESGSETVEKGAPQDQRGDNIFEKFYIETPTSCATDSVRHHSVIPSTLSDTPMLSELESNSDIPTVGSINEAAIEAESASVSTDALLDNLIKAETDTPASPSEASSSNLKSTSKIIPVSPTSAKRLGSTGLTAKTGIRHANPGNFASRKVRGPGIRFPRAMHGVGGAISHSGTPVDSYMRARAHLRGARLGRSYTHLMHRPKGTAFKASTGWSTAAMEFGSPTSGSGESNCAMGSSVGPGAMVPWMMNQGSAGPNPQMPHRAFHPGNLQRPLRPPYGPGPGNMFGPPM